MTAPTPLTPTQTWQGAIETASADGTVRGWACVPGATTPPIVTLSLNGQPLARAIADRFRPDLLSVGERHGHHAFLAIAASSPPPGRHLITLSVAGVAGSISADIDFPNPGPRPTVTVENLLALPPRWTAADLRANPGVLKLTEMRGKLGDARLIDALYRFVLERFPSAGEHQARMAELHHGWLNPISLLRELLTREPEFAARLTPLACPFDLDYPFATD